MIFDGSPQIRSAPTILAHEHVSQIMMAEQIQCNDISNMNYYCIESVKRPVEFFHQMWYNNLALVK